MNKHYKIFGITPTEPTYIMRVFIEQEFDDDKVHTEEAMIKVIQIQATSEVFDTEHGPEANTRIDYLTKNGIFPTDELSGVGIAADEDESTYIELNFSTSRNSNTASLILPKKIYPVVSESKKYLDMIFEYLAPEGYPVEVDKEEIVNFLLGVFSLMTGKNTFVDTIRGN
jgi:hypothetical protein